MSFRDNSGCKRRGRVTAVGDKHRNVRTDDGYILKSVPVVRLRRARDDVLALETRLDVSLGSDRQDGPFFREFFKAYRQEYRARWLYEKVHNRDNLDRFLAKARVATSDFRWVHYMGHGKQLGLRRCRLELTHGQVDLPEDASIFGGLTGRTIVLDCCDVGISPYVLYRILDASEAEAVFAYNGEVQDRQTRLAGSMLYDIMLTQPWVKPRAVAEMVNEALRRLGVAFGGKHHLLTVATW